MNILILTASNPYKTAGVVAHDVYESLKDANKNNDVKIVAKIYFKMTDENVITLSNKYKCIIKLIENKIKNGVRKVVKTHNERFDRQYAIQDYNQTFSYKNTEKILKKISKKPDVILIFFPQTFLMPRDILALYRETNAPILLYLMDMAFITGGCHYAWECNGYKNNCGSCPAMYSSNDNDQSRKNWEVKFNSFRETCIEVIAPSEQLYDQVKDSRIFSKRMIHHILLPINDDTYHAGSMKTAREIHQLPTRKFILLIGSVGFGKRKGFDQLIESLSILKQIGRIADLERVHIAVVGALNKSRAELLPFDFTELGYLSYKELALAFQASNSFLSTSIEDSGPMMLNQSVMCGTPVVAFDIGVAKDLIKNGISGYKSDLYDTHSFALNILNMLRMQSMEYMLLRENTLRYAKSVTQKDVIAKELEKAIIGAQSRHRQKYLKNKITYPKFLRHFY